jgi:hypothetical protein
VLQLGLFAAGFFLGTIFVPQAMRWALLVHTSFGLHGGDFLGAPKRRLLWAVPFIILLHPLPYFAAGTAALTAHAVLGRAPSGSMWLLAGFYAYASFVGALVVPKLLKLRRKTHSARTV